MTPSQFRSMMQQRQNKLKQAVRKFEQDIDCAQRQAKAAHDKWVRDVNREIDRAKQHNKRVVADHNRRVRQRNQNAAAAVNKYKQAVRSHNAAVERDRQRRISALRALSSPRYIEVRTSTFDLNERYERVERTGLSSADLLSLSEREAESSATVAEALATDAPTAPQPEQDSGILEYLAGFSQDLCDRWKGALYALNPINPDAARHFCTSVREIFTEILDKWADNEDVLEADPNAELTPNKTGPSRRAKIRYLLKQKGADTPEMLGFVEQDIEDILQLFHVFNEATHGAAGKHGLTKLQHIRQRVEGGIMFLAAVAL
ncbi:hypothetical protein [Chelativorans multitrophicus]|uniref:pPIWI-associating nuclease domain-containing protein n=1 Tax=Chelativorans multitrophicus TaxID=449973 RepID=UPI0031B607BA